MDTLDRSFVLEFGAMDFSDHLVSEEGSLYSRGPASCDEYVNPQSVCSVQSLASEVAVPIPDNTVPIQEQSNVPSFMHLLEEDDMEKAKHFHPSEEVSYAEMQPVQSPPFYTSLHDVIQTRQMYQQSNTTPNSCKVDDQGLRIPSFENKEFKPCSLEDLDLVNEYVTGEQNLVKQEPVTPAPCAQPPEMPRPYKRRREEDPSVPGMSGINLGNEDPSMSDAERIRKERRKASNRRAAKKCREKKLKEQNAVIQAKETCMAEMEKLRAENERLRRLVAQCPNCNSRVNHPHVHAPKLVFDPS